MFGWMGGKGTLRPCFIDMWPAARLMRSLGTKRGETFLGPWTVVKVGGWWAMGRRDEHLSQGRWTCCIALLSCQCLNPYRSPV